MLTYYGYSYLMPLAETQIVQLNFENQDCYDNFLLFNDYLIFESYDEAVLSLKKEMKKQIGLLIDRTYIISTTPVERIKTHNFKNESL